MAQDELLFLPLGGAGEIGINLNLYGCRDQWLMIDLGVMFGDDATPGIEVIVPDPGFIVERRDQLVGLVLTHAHEDHLGAVPHLWPQLRCPVYATPFTAWVLRRKLEEFDLVDDVPITEVPLGGRFAVGPFDLELVTLTHSIPEPNAVVIRTPLGTVMHTGDWKLDPDPLVGETVDEAALRALGAEGVLAMVCDSTNALTEGASGSEADLRESLIELAQGWEGRIAIASFASNVARLETVAAVAEAHGRYASLVGRSLWRMHDAARASGYLKGVRPFLPEEEIRSVPPDKLVVACTGSQGEPRAALTRIAENSHASLSLDPGDVVIFSSRIIPGNEKAIFRLQNDLVRQGVEVITERDHFVHVSGHPARDELTRMYQWVRPQIAVPVHGELRHLHAHEQLARACQVGETVVVENGGLVRLAPGPAKVVDHLPTGRLGVEGDLLLSLDSEAVRVRRRIMYNGTASASLVVDGAGALVTAPSVAYRGFPEEETEALQQAGAAAIEVAVAELRPAARREDEDIREAARLALRRVINVRFAKRPVTDVHVTRL
ncbi:MAG: ribonuclease J [Alphaproteobacteria bacterium]|nr:ribonuclease J [Alphaproteobacteria bacterium]